MAPLLQLLLVAGLFFRVSASAPSASAPGLGSLASEEEVLELMGRPGAGDSVLASVEAAGDVEDLVHKGWHDAVRSLVAIGRATSADLAQKVTAQVRHAVYAERNRLDDLVRALDENYGKAVDVNPAMQWAQNSTHVFIAVKFCRRWNAPGALEVENETVAFSACCFNFTAFGEHSFIRRRYHLSFELFRPTISAVSSWFFASAGRVTVTIAKKAPGNWPRLFLAAEAEPKNLGIWLDMREKWKADLQKLPLEESDRPAKSASKPPPAEKKGSSKKQKRKKAAQRDSDDDDDALDREVELLSECPKSTFSGTGVAELCGKSFQDVAESPAVPGRRWLVEMYSSTGTGDLEAMKTLMPIWKRLADVFPSMAPGGRVGAVDCGHDKELCKRLGATKLPQIRRFTAGSAGDEWKGALDASMEALAAWGSGKDEL